VSGLVEVSARRLKGPAKIGGKTLYYRTMIELVSYIAAHLGEAEAFFERDQISSDPQLPVYLFI
jgi:hypothetical protein